MIHLGFHTSVPVREKAILKHRGYKKSANGDVQRLRIIDEDLNGALVELVQHHGSGRCAIVDDAGRHLTPVMR